ncbi:MAG: hypothetical protein KBT67_10640 [bacterium]|nr:hypothetical protein [Candidatus Limimorpha caballi]
MKKIVFSLIIMLAMAFAATAQHSGQCGDNLTWNFDEGSRTLTVSGTGDMWDSDQFNTTWLNLNITDVVMQEGVTMTAQEYVPVIQEGNEWHTLDVTVASYNTYYNNVNWFSGDTVIDDVRYAKLMGTADGNTPRLFSLLREEDGKV